MKNAFLALMTVTILYAAPSDVNVSKNESVKLKIDTLNAKIASNKKEQAFMSKTRQSMDSITIMTHQAKSEIEETSFMYRNRERLAVESEIESIESRIKELKGRNNPAFNDDIKKQVRSLQVAKQRLQK